MERGEGPVFCVTSGPDRVFPDGRGSVHCMKSFTSIALILLGWRLASGQGTQTNVAEQYLFAAANQDRAANHLPPLRQSDHLAQAARLHAFKMVKHGAISHQFTGEADLAERAGKAGAHFSLITEKVAESPDASRIEDMWMASAGHRANLLDAKVDSIGIAVIRDRGGYYAVEDFARTVQVLSLADQETQVGSLVAQTGVAVLTATPEARQTCSMKQGFAGRRQPWFVMRYTTSNLERLPQQLESKLSSGRYHEAMVGACVSSTEGPFAAYNLAVLLFR